MKKIILSILALIIINNAYAMLPGQPECPQLKDTVVIENMVLANTHSGMNLLFHGNKDSLRINPTLSKKLQQTPDHSPATCLTGSLHKDSKPVGVIIPVDVMELIKKQTVSHPSKPTVENHIYAINQYSPRILYEKAESQQRESLDEAEIKEIDEIWRATRISVKIAESNNNTSYFKPLTLLTCLSVAVALYFFWHRR